jgi:hypothetical protein
LGRKLTEWLSDHGGMSLMKLRMRREQNGGKI